MSSSALRSLGFNSSSSSDSPPSRSNAPLVSPRLRNSQTTQRVSGSPRTPSGFGLSSPSSHNFPSSPSLRGKRKTSSFKGHSVQRMGNILQNHPILCVIFTCLVVVSLIWISVMKFPTTLPEANSLFHQANQDLPITQTNAVPMVDPVQVIDPTPVVASQSNETPAAAPVTELHEAESSPNERPSRVENERQSDIPQVVPPNSDIQEDNSDKLMRSDLIDSDLVCPMEVTANRAACDFSWDENTPVHEEDGAPSADTANQPPTPKRPQDFYTFQAGVHVTGEGPGALVRIRMRDLCCMVPPGSVLPLSYFRVTAVGAAQAAANPPLSLGPMPSALGRGHKPVHLTQFKWGRDMRLHHVDQERVLQTFVLLPDPGYYEIRVRLLHYNSSVDMISENYQMNSKLYGQRPGLWVNGFLKNANGVRGTKLFIPMEAALQSRAYTDRSRMPLCGTESEEHYGRARSHTGTEVGMPLAGRWVLKNEVVQELLAEQANTNPTAAASSATSSVRSTSHIWEIDLTDRSPRWLVEHSIYQPYFCYLDQAVPYANALNRVGWMHFTGDSNIRHMFYYVCEVANGTLFNVNPDNVPRYLDPPHFCLGPPSSESGTAQWVLTYTNWFWGKPQTLQPTFAFREQCSQFVEQNKTGLFYGWPHCDKAPEFIQQMRGPGATYFGWGSHAAEFGLNPLTQAYFDSNEAFALPYFSTHATLFPLTTANTPSLIPDKFGPQQRMRNNERVHASNLHLVEAVKTAFPTYHSNSEQRWLPLFDLFSPTHAAYEALAVDAVHFEKFFSYEEPKWLMHFIFHAPNFANHAEAATAATHEGAASGNPIRDRFQSQSQRRRH